MASGSAATTLASIANDAWDDIVELCRSKLSEEDFENVSSVGSLEGLIAYSKALLEDCQNDPRAYDIGRLNGFIAQLRTFNGTFEHMLRANPSVTAPLWGSIQLCVQLVQEGADVLRIIVDMFTDVNYVLPRIDVYSKTLSSRSESLTRSTLMLLIAEFACLVIVYYRENPIRNIVVITWTPFRPVFERIVARIQQTARHIEFEAHALAMQDSTTRYEELKRLLTSVQKDKPEPKTSCFCVSRPRNPKFVGREGILKEMDTALNPRHHKSKKQTVYSLFGLGGVGKTQLALEYLYVHKDEFPVIIWLSAETTQKLDQDIREATSRLGLVLEQDKETESKLRAVLKTWLKETDIPWLLVFDNADQPKLLQEYWPVAEHGSILLTSRNPASARIRASGYPSKGRQITPLNEEEGAGLLLSLLQDDDNQEDFMEQDLSEVEPSESTYSLACRLAEELGGLPLAIDQMASYILETGSSLASFLDVFLSFQNKSHFLLESSNPNLDLGYSHSMSTVWEVSLSRVTSNGRHLLELLVFYDPDSIPESLFVDGAKSPPVNTPHDLEWLANKLQFMEASKSLFEQSLVTKNKGHSAFVLHRLVRTVTLTKMEAEDRQARFNEAVHLIHRVCPRLSPDESYLNRHWPTMRLYLPHILALESQYREQGTFAPTAELADILTSAAWFLMEQAQLRQSLEILATAKSVGLATKTGNEFMAAQIYVLYGVIYVDIQDRDKAFKALSTSLDILKETDGCDELALAAGYNGFGYTAMTMGNFDVADEYLKMSVGLREKHPSRNPGMLGICYSNISCLRWAQGQYEDSLRFAEIAIPLCEGAYGVAGEKTAQPYWRKGNTLIRLGRLEDAFTAHMRALDIRKEATPGGFKFAASLHKVAWIFAQQGDHASAEYVPVPRALLSKAISIYEATDERKGELARSTYLMSAVLKGMGKTENAEYAKAVAAQLRKGLTGLQSEVNDNQESYDLLVSLLER
ncbi:uncharacterized protein BDZ99DRAFT_392655 [Mytilinidion resinicola]|uniref:NB-ARC domain-containing protein n=1 Tax=Mytilinidion resinicola TaxID=574789 RepID=A0A6A6YEG8_9PEZI|nr:uncharacterized protein BDZ99DRAFT_392655 [Mytilinidion resinicola]KAF2807216.1 hypothetical protein BDZ99DRAFT_392655 [Mytilinidion resinicola]